MNQGRFDIPPDDTLFWETDRSDTPFGPDIERQRIQAEREADAGSSWIRTIQDRRRKEKQGESLP